MDAHLKNSDIDNFVSGVATGTEINRVDKHIRYCDVCRDKVRILSEILEEKVCESVPGVHVKEAVIAEWHRTHSSNALKKRRPMFSFKPAYGFAAVVLLIVSVYLGNKIIFHEGIERNFKVAFVSGDVIVNDKTVAEGYILKNGDSIITGDGGSASLSSDQYNLDIKNITEVRLSKNNKAGFEFVLARGSVVSRSHSKDKYSFRCASFSVMPIGTEFRLDLENQKLGVSVLSGGVIVSGENFQIEVPSGKKWISDNPNHLAPLTKENMTGIKTGKENNSVNESVKNGKADDNEVSASNKKSYKTRADYHERRELKKEIRDDIKEMKKEKRRGKQIRGGN